MKKVCKYCGSEDVKKDAWAVWNEKKDRWELYDYFDNDYCEECGEETTIVDEDEYVPNIESREVESEYDEE